MTQERDELRDTISDLVNAFNQLVQDVRQLAAERDAALITSRAADADLIAQLQQRIDELQAERDLYFNQAGMLEGNGRATAWELVNVKAERDALALKLGAQAEEIMAQTERARVFGESNSQLRDALAAQQRWEPVPDGEYGGLEVSENGREISLNTQDVHGITWDAIHFLPNDMRLCRRQGGNDAQ